MGSVLSNQSCRLIEFDYAACSVEPLKVIYKGNLADSGAQLRYGAPVDYVRRLGCS